MIHLLFLTGDEYHCATHIVAPSKTVSVCDIARQSQIESILHERSGDYEVEKHIAEVGVRATILAPVSFIENLYGMEPWAQ